MALLIREKGTKSDENIFQKEYLLKQIEILKAKLIEEEDRTRIGISQEKNRASETIDRELLAIKRNFGEAEEEYQYKIARLMKQLEEKEAVSNTSFSRHDKLSK